MKNETCTQTAQPGCSVTVKVDVAKIIGRLCMAGVLIVAIVFGSKCVNTYLNSKSGN